MKNSTKNSAELYLTRELDPAFARRARLIAENLDLKGKEHILEVGCGRGFYEQFLGTIYPTVKITGIDLKESYLNIARHTVKNKNVTFLNADATNLPLKAKTFDRIIATEVLEHIPDEQAVLRELHRVLKPEGILVITVPHKEYPFAWDPLNYILEKVFHTHMPSNIWWLAGIWADHVRLYTESELVERVKAGGFRIKNVWRATHFCVPFSHFLLYGIGKNIVEWGFIPQLSRFSADTQPGAIHRIIHRITNIWDQKNREEGEMKKTTSVNLVLVARKK